MKLFLQLLTIKLALQFMCYVVCKMEINLDFIENEITEIIFVHWI